MLVMTMLISVFENENCAKLCIDNEQSRTNSQDKYVIFVSLTILMYLKSHKYNKENV